MKKTLQPAQVVDIDPAQVARLNEELAHAHLVIQAREETITELLKAPHINYATENAALKQTVSSLRKDLAQKSKAKLEAVATLDQTLSDLSAKYERDVKQVRLPEDVEARLRLLTEERDETNKQFQEKSKQVARLQAEIAEHEKAVKYRVEHIIELQEKIVSLEQDLSALAAKYEREIKKPYSTQVAELEAKLRHSEAQAEQLATTRNTWMEEAENRWKLIQELRQNNEQATATVQELLSERQTIMADNCNLLSANREMQEQLEEIQEAPKIEAAPQADVQPFQDETVRNRHLEAQLSIANKQLEASQIRERWQKDLISNEHIESGAKVLALGLQYAMREKSDERGYTPLISEEVFGQKIGMGRNAVSSNLRRLAQSGALELLYGEVEKEVSNRNSKRKVICHPVSVRPAPIWEQPHSLRKPGEVKKHGGFSKPCGNCGHEDWENVPHKRCRNCGREEVKYPLTEAQKLMNEAAIEARQWDNIMRAEWEVTRQGTPMIDAQAQSIEPEAPKIEAAPQADVQPFQDETVRNQAQEEQTEEAQEETHEERMLRYTAETWREIEAKDPGCFVPEHIIAYWKKHEGREYIVLHEREELPVVSTPEPEHETRKVANLKTGRIETVLV